MSKVGNSSAWKNLERFAAASLGGKRNSRGGDFGQPMADVTHPLFVVEAKYRKQLPRILKLGLQQAQQYNRTKVPLLILKEKHQRGAFAVLKLSDFTTLLDSPPRDGVTRVRENTHENTETLGGSVHYSSIERETEKR